MKNTLQTVAILITNVSIGGTVRHAKEIAHAWSMQECQVLYVEVIDSITKVRCLKKGDIIKEYLFVDDKNGQRLERLLQAYHVQLLHVEHLFNAPTYFLSLHKKLKIPLAIVMHDYYMICPFIKLTYEDESYCGEKGIAACQQCLARRKFVYGASGTRVQDIYKWRKMWEEYLEGAALVVVPSRDMEKRVRKYYPNIHLRMIENPELIPVKSQVKQIGLIGALSKAKGGQKVKECLDYCAANHLKLHFVLFGTLPDIVLNTDESKYITILGPYEEETIYSQIPEHLIDFFWFPGICPETYSYTLTIPVRLGIPCISTDLGAIASRIQEHHWGQTYPWQYGAAQIIQELTNFPYTQYENPNFEIQNTSFGCIEEYYEGISIPAVNDSCQEQIPISDNINQLMGTYNKEEFHILWQLAQGKEKLHLLWHIDRRWVKDVLKKRGIRYFVKKIRKKYF